MNALMLLTGRGRYHLDKLRRRVSAATGQWLWRFSATSFPHRIRKSHRQLALVDVVYHLFGGLAGHRVHPHVQRSFRLKTKSALCVPSCKLLTPRSLSNRR